MRGTKTAQVENWRRMRKQREQEEARRATEAPSPDTEAQQEASLPSERSDPGETPHGR